MARSLQVVKKMAEMTERILAKNELTGKDVDCFIAHQANRASLPRRRSGWGCRWRRSSSTLTASNTTAGTIPIAMQTALEEGRLKKGDRVLIATVGASGATLLRWAF
jgi:3-oxoacyl-[acyl-carrier-protein] synthase III